MMNKRFINKKTVKWAAVTAAAILGVSGVFMPGSKNAGRSYAAETDAETESRLTETLEQFVSHSAEAGKEETVYVIAAGDGTAQNVIVSSWLKNAEGADTLTDTTILKNIENVKGSQTYTSGSGNEITWQAQGSDIYYRGTTDAQLPVGMKITYYLDGKVVSPQEIAGKSGHVKIRFDYENRISQKMAVGGNMQEIYVPFIVLSGAVFPLDRFSAVTVSSGRVISEGNNQIAVGLTLPGMSKNLSISKEEEEALAGAGLDTGALHMEFPDYFEIEADAHDFALDMTLTVMLPDAFSAVRVGENTTENGGSDLGELSQKILSLKDSLTQLSQSSAQLVEGSAQLSAGAGDLAAGAQSLEDGAKSLNGGMQQLSAGGKEVSGGVAQLAGSLTDMMKQLKPAHDGYAQFQQAVAGVMASGMSKEQAIAAVMQAQGMTESELTYLATLSGIYDALSANAGSVTALVQGAADLSSGIDTAAQGAKSLYDGAAALSDGADALYAGSQTLAGGMSQFDEQGIQALASMAAGYEAAGIMGLADKVKAILAAADAYHTFSGAPEGVDASVKFIIRTEAVR